MTSLLVGSLTGLDVAQPAGAHAMSPPVAGTVSCTLTANSTFDPALGYRQGIGGKKVSPSKDAKWRLEGTLTGCSGTQTGGSSRTGPIARGELLIKGRATGHQCATLTASGMTLKTMRIKWFDAQGNRIPTTRAVGAASVAGLLTGFPFVSFNPPVLDPGYVTPGIITVNATGTATSNARAFPGQHVSMSATADQVLDGMVTPCNTHQVPSLTFGVDGFGFNGVNGPASITIS